MHLFAELQHLFSSPTFSDMQNQILFCMALPVYCIFIPLELIISNIQHRHFYTWKDTITNIYLNILNAGIDVLFRVVALGILFYFYQYAIVTIHHKFSYWLLLFLLEDIAFYFEHRVDHFCRFFWAIHVTHHSSQEYNLSTGFRSSVLMPFYRFIYFIPLVLLGFHPIDIAFMYALTQTYGILVHTKYINSMPAWFAFVFVTPGHHRVHHASNVEYLDKNMGMCLIIWDRIFGTFQQEEKNITIQYGITKSIENPNAINIVFHEWQNLWKDVLQKNITWKQRLQYIVMPPGWSHAGNSKTSKQLREEKP